MKFAQKSGLCLFIGAKLADFTFIFVCAPAFPLFFFPVWLLDFEAVLLFAGTGISVLSKGRLSDFQN